RPPAYVDRPEGPMNLLRQALSLGNSRCHAAPALRLAFSHTDSTGRNRRKRPRASNLSIHLFDDASHGLDERSQLPPLGDGVGGIAAVLEGIAIAPGRAWRLAAVHPAASVRHRWRL